MKDQSIFLNEILRRQFRPSFKMIENIIRSCPKSIWARKNIDPPIWQQVYHVLYGTDYWFSKSKEQFVPPGFEKNVHAVLGEESTGFIEQDDMLKYLVHVEKKVVDFISDLDVNSITNPSKLYTKWTNLDVVLEQIRHFQHHLGYLNHVLLKCKIRPVEWEFFENT